MSDENNALKPGGSGNIDGLNEAIKSRFDAEVDVRQKRQLLNAEIGLARAKLEEKGVPKKVQAMGVAYMMLSAEHRQLHKEMMDVITEVIDENFEPDLFAD